MEGKDTFTKEEADKIRDLLKELRDATKQDQKSIRRKLRNIGFYISDWGLSGMTVSDFDNLIKDGSIKIIPSSNTSKSVPAQRTVLPTIKNVETSTNLQFRKIADLTRAGFEGFVPVSDLWKDHSVIPNIKGVYMVVRTKDSAPEFLAKGTGGFYHNEDPNVPIDVLRANWVDDTCVVYIGQTGGKQNGKEPENATLHERLNLYLGFGQGKKKGHRGGRYIWQLKDAADLLFCWKPLPADDPREVESSLISSFKKCYGGKRPFANIRD